MNTKKYITHILLGNSELVKRADVNNTDEEFADMIASSVHYFYGYDSLICNDKNDKYLMIDAKIPEDNDLKSYMKNSENINSLLNYLEYMCPNAYFFNEKKELIYGLGRFNEKNIKL